METHDQVVEMLEEIEETIIFVCNNKCKEHDTCEHCGIPLLAKEFSSFMKYGKEGK